MGNSVMAKCSATVLRIEREQNRCCGQNQELECGSRCPAQDPLPGAARLLQQPAMSEAAPAQILPHSSPHLGVFIFNESVRDVKPITTARLVGS